MCPQQPELQWAHDVDHDVRAFADHTWPITTLGHQPVPPVQHLGQIQVANRIDQFRKARRQGMVIPIQFERPGTSCSRPYWHRSVTQLIDREHEILDMLARAGPTRLCHRSAHHPEDSA